MSFTLSAGVRAAVKIATSAVTLCISEYWLLELLEMTKEVQTQWGWLG